MLPPWASCSAGAALPSAEPGPSSVTNSSYCSVLASLMIGVYPFPLALNGTGSSLTKPGGMARGCFDGRMDATTVVAIVIAVVGLVLILASGKARRSSVETARLAAIERKLDAVMRHLGIEEPAPAQDPDVVSHLVKGEKIHAIKVYRERTGVSLAEAKDAVEHIARTRGLG